MMQRYVEPQIILMSGLPLCTVADGNLNLDLRAIQQGRQRIKRSTLRSLASSSFRVPVTHQNEAPQQPGGTPLESLTAEKKSP